MPKHKQKPLKRAKIASRGKSKRSILTKRADYIFSIYIRRKDAINNQARCVTCWALDDYRMMQNGHFISRGKIATRWDEQNCHVQCPNCNENLRGNLKQYEIYLESKYGEGTAAALKQKANSGIKVSTPDIEDIIKVYTKKVQDL